MKPRSVAVRYVAATGSPFSDRDAAVIGRELARIADDNAVENIRALDVRLVLDEAKRKTSPLHKFYVWDRDAAAEAYYLAFTGRMIRSIRVVIKTGRLETREPLFVTSRSVPRHNDRGKVVRRTAQVRRDDLLANDPLFMSAIGMHIRRVVDAVNTLERLTASRDAPAAVTSLVASLVSACAEYSTQVIG